MLTEKVQAPLPRGPGSVSIPGRARKQAVLLLAALLALSTAFAAPRRLVCLSPNLAEIVYGVGAFDQVVGVSKFASYPPAVSKLPTLGGWQDPDYEKIVALRPDLVLVDEGQAPFVEDKIKQLGLHVLVVKDERAEDVYTAITAVGKATGHDAEAAKLVQATRDGLLRVSQKTAALPKVKGVLIVDRTPGTLNDLYTATAGSFLAELVDIAGGRVAVPPDKRGYAKLSKEDLLAIDPEVILDFTHGSVGRLAGDPLEAWKEMPELKAVRTHRVCEVNEDYVPHASQRMVQTAELFARLLHPEVK